VSTLSPEPVRNLILFARYDYSFPSFFPCDFRDSPLILPVGLYCLCRRYALFRSVFTGLSPRSALPPRHQLLLPPFARGNGPPLPSHRVTRFPFASLLPFFRRSLSNYRVLSRLFFFPRRLLKLSVPSVHIVSYLSAEGRLSFRRKALVVGNFPGNRRSFSYTHPSRNARCDSIPCVNFSFFPYLLVNQRITVPF